MVYASSSSVYGSNKKIPYATEDKVYNIGNNHPENLLDFVDLLQDELKSVGVLPAASSSEAKMI